jgi:hypothetical protein
MIGKHQVVAGTLEAHGNNFSTPGGTFYADAAPMKRAPAFLNAEMSR